MVASGLEEKNMTVKQLKQKLSSKEQEIESKDISIEEKTKLYINAQVLFEVERKERKRLEALGVGQSDDGSSHLEEEKKKKGRNLWPSIFTTYNYQIIIMGVQLQQGINGD